MKKILLGAAIAALLAGCGSSVKLDAVPVEDKVATEVTTRTESTAANPGQSAQTAVTAVDLSKSGQDMAGPPGSSTVYFDYDSYVVKPEFQPVVESQARHLRADTRRKAMLEGHTDDRGGREYNLALGQRRAEAVGRALVLLGVPGSQMEAVSFGKEKPAVPGLDEVAMAKNRRVEVKYR
jgi:peptidoglycan-associated lipoprotein